ncbi:MAG: TolC family protein, partial [Burkholderiaceae bacterium]|nr:TolC family protein [Burkholderiaceae bacterium]
MIGRTALLAVLAGALVPALAPAQAQVDPTSPTQCLRFGEALALGARLAPEVQTAEARLAEGEAELAQARALFRPQLSTFVRTGIGDSGLTDSQIENQIGLRGTQRIFDFGDSRFARQAARATVAARQFDIAAAEAAAAETVGQSYLGWLETRDRLQATRQREAYFGRQLASTESLLGQGGATVADRADIDAEYLEAQSARTELEFLLERFGTRLAISTKRTNDPCAADDVSQTLSQMLQASANEGIVAATLATSPQIASLRSSADSLLAAAYREARSRFPVISVTGISSYAVDDFDTRGALRNRAGIDVSIPLYSGKAQTARIDA